MMEVSLYFFFSIMVSFAFGSIRRIPAADKGIIGLSSLEAERLGIIDVWLSPSGCRWFGTAPLCRERCPFDWNEERSASSRYPPFWLSPSIEEEFGKPCFPFREKFYCCQANRQDRTWAGEWVSAQSGKATTCKYYVWDEFYENVKRSICGRLICHRNMLTPGVYYDIGGGNCTTLWPAGSDDRKDRKGLASNGVISWIDGSQNDVDRWYKASK